VVVVLNDVDPVYVNESRNAFTRYNKETYYNQPMNVLIVSLTEKVNMVTIRGFSNEQEAIDYIAKARVQANKDIIPWLKTDKYYFMPVAEDNMNLLIANKNLPEYRNFLEQLFPGQF
jgi:predicted alpha-1,6-mannanase (GH76 family)